MSEAAEQLEAMAAEAEMLKGNITDIIKKMETLTPDDEMAARVESKRSICSAAQLHCGGPLPPAASNWSRATYQQNSLPNPVI